MKGKIEMAKEKAKKLEPEGLNQDATLSGELNEGELDKVTGGTADGISLLITVTQMKSNNANDEAMRGADAQRSLIKSQKKIRH